MKKPSKRAKKERIMRLVDFALETASSDIRRSEAALETALRVLKRYNVRGVPVFRRYFLCHECKKVMIPGRTAKVRVSSGKVKSLAITCSSCGRTYRIPLTKKKRDTKENAQCRPT